MRFPEDLFIVRNNGPMKVLLRKFKVVKNDEKCFNWVFYLTGLFVTLDT